MLPKKWIMGIVGASTTLNALQPISDINVSGGFRSDRFRSRVTTSEDCFTIGQDLLDANNINIWQAGFDGVLRLPNLWEDRCPCDDGLWWLGQFYIRGSTYWGSGSVGHVRERATDYTDDVVVKARGKIHKARTFDYNGAVGWLFSCNRWLAIGPVGGLSYNRLFFRTSMNHCDLDGMNFTSRFHTTFVGIDALVDTGCVYMRGGYEYHFLHKWTGNFKVRGDVISDSSFSDRRRSHDGFGHLVYFEARMPICDYYWEWGLKGQMSYRRVRRGSCHFYNTHGAEVPDAHTKYARWFSLSIVADLGYNF